MAGFLYYVPTDTPPTRDTLAELEFPHSHIAAVPGRHVETGPVDIPGYVFALQHPRVDTLKIGYWPIDQSWLECAAGKFFIGRVTADPPNPIDLVRSDMVEGLPVDMADGNAWIVPAIRNHIDDSPKVESVLRLSSAGELINDTPAPQYMRMWKLVQKLYNNGNPSTTELTPDECFRLIADVMSLHYNISVWELGALSIITTKNIEQVFSTIMGVNDGKG